MRLPYYIFMTKENRAKPPVPVVYRLIVARDGTIEAIGFAHGAPTKGTKWHPLFVDDVDVYRIIVEMLAKAFVSAKVDCSPMIAEDGTRFLGVNV
jgi:hypothetical protein